MAFADPLSLPIDSVPNNRSFTRVSQNANGSDWVCTDMPASDVRMTMKIRHSVGRPVNKTIGPIRRDNVTVTIEKYNSTTGTWQSQSCSATITGPGKGGSVLSDTEIDTPWYFLYESFFNSTRYAQLVRGEC